MPITYDRVKPGDLIIADHFNTLFTTFVDTINELERRIVLLESNRSIQLVNVLPPSVDTSDMGTSRIATYAFDLGYVASAPPMTAKFSLTIGLLATPVSTLIEWAADFADDPMSTTTTGVFVTTFELDATAIGAKRITVRVKTPAARGTEDKTVTFAAMIKSTDLPTPISVESNPFTITVKKG
jgi:hypothetical protein